MNTLVIAGTASNLLSQLLKINILKNNGAEIMVINNAKKYIKEYHYFCGLDYFNGIFNNKTGKLEEYEIIFHDSPTLDKRILPNCGLSLSAGINYGIHKGFNKIILAGQDFINSGHCDGTPGSFQPKQIRGITKFVNEARNYLEIIDLNNKL